MEPDEPDAYYARQQALEFALKYDSGRDDVEEIVANARIFLNFLTNKDTTSNG